MIQFPEKFQERMQQMLGDEEYAEFLKSYDLPFHNGLRINTWKTKPQELLQRMGVDLKQVPWNETGFYLENKKQFSKHPNPAAYNSAPVSSKSGPLSAA